MSTKLVNNNKGTEYLTIQGGFSGKLTNLNRLIKFLLTAAIVTGLTLNVQQHANGNGTKLNITFINISIISVFIGSYLYFTLLFYFSSKISTAEIITVILITIACIYTYILSTQEQEVDDYKLVTDPKTDKATAQLIKTYEVDENIKLLNTILLVPIGIFLIIFIYNYIYEDN